MLTGYSENHKAYRLIDVDIDHLTFSRDVVFDKEAGPFQLSSDIKSPKDQPLQTKDFSV